MHPILIFNRGGRETSETRKRIAKRTVKKSARAKTTKTSVRKSVTRIAKIRKRRERGML